MNIPRPFITVCSLFIALGSNVIGQENTDHRLPLKTASWDGISKRLNEAEIVVVGMVNSFEARDQEDDSRDLSTPSRKLNHYLRKLRELGGEVIPGSEDKVHFSDKISVLIVESGNGEESAKGEAHKQKARLLYEMLGAPPYVMSNPVIFLIYKGKLVRSYGDYHEPGIFGVKLQQLAATLLSPEIPDSPLLPEIVMMKTLALRKEKGDKEAIAYFTDQFLQTFGTPRFYGAYSYFWTEAHVRSGAEDALWASMVFDVLFTTCQRPGYFDSSMQVVSNLCSNLSACGRFGRLAEVMAVWEQGQKMAGNRMDISSYQDMGPAISCLPEIRHRDMPITQPSEKSIPAGSNANGFHVNDAGAFGDYASLQYTAGRWQEALEYAIWIRDWATDKKNKQLIGEFATSWYAATSTLISCLKYMGF